jgi:AcrR family transcriptional regulator
MPRRPRPLSDPEHPRRRLLTAATSAFSQNGYDRTSIDVIAEGAGLPKSGLYYYFPNKQALIVAIAEEATGLIQARLDEIERQALPPDAELEAAISEHARLIIERLPAMRVLLRELPQEAPELKRIATERIRYRQRLMKIIRRGIGAGVFAPVEPRIATEAIIGMVNGLVDWYSPSGPLSAGHVVETCARLAVQALRL